MKSKGVSLTTEEGLWLLIKLGMFVIMIVTFGMLILSPEGECERLDKNPRGCIDNIECRPIVKIETPGWFDFTEPRDIIPYTGCTKAVRAPHTDLNCNDAEFNCDDWEWSEMFIASARTYAMYDDWEWKCVDDDDGDLGRYYGTCMVEEVYDEIDDDEMDPSEGWKYTLPPNFDP